MNSFVKEILWRISNLQSLWNSPKGLFLFVVAEDFIPIFLYTYQFFVTFRANNGAGFV